MAFCTACGAPMESSARFCTKCGAGAAGAGTPAAPARAAAATQMAPVARSTTGRNALSIALIVVVVVVALGALATIGTVFAVRKMAHKVRVEAGPNSAVVTTPFGSVTANDPTIVAKQLGVEVYPGARGIKDSAVVAFGGMNVAAAKFESDDAPEKIMEFYQKRYPKADVRIIGSDNSMVFSTEQGMVTIKVHALGDGSLLEIARVGGTGGAEKSN